jgi:tetratricopeptide (TPR) repeat protein
LLLNKSLIRRSEGLEGEPRFWMLETIREYALEQLEASGAADEVLHRHSTYYLDLAERAAPEFHRADQITWLDRTDADHDNLRAVLHRAIEHGDEHIAQRLVTALTWFWDFRGYWTEAPLWFQRALALGLGHRTQERARALIAMGFFHVIKDEYESARAVLDEGLAICNELGDAYGHALARMWLAASTESFERLINIEQSVTEWRALGEEWGLRWALWQLETTVYFVLGDTARAFSLAQESLSLARQSGDRVSTSNALRTLGHHLKEKGEYAAARACFEEGLQLAQEMRNIFGEAMLRRDLGELCLSEGKDLMAAHEHLNQALTVFCELGAQYQMAATRNSLGNLARSQRDFDTAQDFFEQSLSVYRQQGWGTPIVLNKLAVTLCFQGDFDRARTTFATSFAEIPTKDKRTACFCLCGLVGLAIAEARFLVAARLIGAADCVIETERIVMPNPDRSEYKYNIAAARDALEVDTFDALYTEGRAMSLKDAITYALDNTPDD